MVLERSAHYGGSIWFGGERLLPLWAGCRQRISRLLGVLFCPFILFGLLAHWKSAPCSQGRRSPLGFLPQSAVADTWRNAFGTSRVLPSPVRLTIPCEWKRLWNPTALRIVVLETRLFTVSPEHQEKFLVRKTGFQTVLEPVAISWVVKGLRRSVLTFWVDSRPAASYSFLGSRWTWL